MLLWRCAAAELPPNRWVPLGTDPAGARRGSAIRYVPEARAFFLWGFMNADPDLLQEQPLMQVPEYDMVAFDPDDGRWRSQFPPGWSGPRLAYVPRTYSGITTGSERTVMRGVSEDREGAPRPDLNIVFDQVTWHPGMHALVYFTGGLTAAYDVSRRRWSDLAPAHAPPPVLGGSLAFDPVRGDVILFGGGHVAERAPDGGIAGYTGTWIYRLETNDWEQLASARQPPPRMNTRMVCDTRNQVLVLFGGDAQSHYLADTWLLDLKTRAWRLSKAAGPPARAGHFTVYDPQTGSVIIGGGYNQQDLTDMWAYRVAEDRWQRIEGEVPAGFYLSADIAPEKRLIVLVTNTRKPGDRMTCNVLFPVRTTYGYRIAAETTRRPGEPAAQEPVPKRAPHPADTAPTRTWGTATFDSDRGRILYWGGGHCGYGGDDVDAYDPATHTWRSGDAEPEYPERLWNHGVRLAGVTFAGHPWTDHGRRIFAYDPVSHKMIMVRSIRLTTGYDPAVVRDFPARVVVAPDALVRPPSSYEKFATWTYDPDGGKWELAGGAPAGLDTLVSTPRGVMAINVNWPARLNDAGYQLPWSPAQPPEDNALYLYRAAAKTWERLSARGQPSPQNLYEMTGLAYDSKRNQVILHGGGKQRNELWTFEMAARRWRNRGAANAPACTREAIYIPGSDVMLILGETMWAYRPGENTWKKLDMPFAYRTTQNRAMVYDARRELILVVLGAGGDNGTASVYGLRYKDGVLAREW